MIFKTFELNAIKLKKNKFILFYGKNEGFKNESLSVLIEDKNKILNYEEKEILDNENSFTEGVLTKSLFDEEKIIVIKRATDKILKIIENLATKNLEDIYIIIDSDNLEKKSKLRSYFEKSKKYVCVAFYPDNDQILSTFTHNFLKKKNISISSANINLIVSKCNGDRETLLNELRKLECFSLNGKKITTENITKLTNLAENYSISELTNNCLAKNQKKITHILNENNFGNEDCILITRTLLNKSKKLLQLSIEFKNNNNIDQTVSSAKPPIFWKDKEITKQQIYKWTPENIKNLIYELNKIELIIKKNVNISINLITNFIIEQTSSITNN